MTDLQKLREIAEHFSKPVYPDVGIRTRFTDTFNPSLVLKLLRVVECAEKVVAPENKDVWQIDCQQQLRTALADLQEK